MLDLELVQGNGGKKFMLQTSVNHKENIHLFCKKEFSHSREDPDHCIETRWSGIEPNRSLQVLHKQ